MIVEEKLVSSCPHKEPGSNEGYVVHVLCITFPLADGDVKIEVREADYLKPKKHLSLFR